MRPLTLGQLGEIFDGPHATPSRTDAGPYFLNIASLVDGRLDLAQSDHVSESDFAAWTRRVVPEAGDLLFSYETRLGDAALMPERVRACLGRRMALLRPDREVVDPRYLLYYYLSPSFQELIKRNAVHGATVNRIALSTLGSWPVRIAELNEQRAIAEVLGALDDKIAANAAVIHKVRVLSRVVYSAMEQSDREVPLTDAARFVNGKAFTKDATGTGRIVIRIAELNSGVGGSTVYNDIDVPDDFLARPGDLLFAWSGSLTVQRWYRDEAIINQHIFKVVPKEGYPLWLVNQLLEHKLEEFRAIAADKATTMGHIQRRHLEELTAVPTRQAIAQRDELMSSLWQLALNTERESLTLTALRDTILPELMSGRLRIKDAEKQVEAVV